MTSLLTGNNASGAAGESAVNVVFVDDDAGLLDSIRRVLVLHDLGWKASFVQDIHAAWDAVCQGGVDVVVTDLHMPGGNGSVLLDKLRQHHPHVARIVLSGHTDSQHLETAIGYSHQYFQKPCSPESLIRGISRALSVRRVLSSREMSKVVGGISSLPGLPKVTARLLAVLDAPAADARARAVSKDWMSNWRCLPKGNPDI